MAKYKIGWNMGYSGTEQEDIIEADSMADAELIAWETAIQGVSSWAEALEEDEEDG